uniref:MIF4G domain-containing protein n=1 Tax=Megaselia scalaris TaxID=36166 RepID=T1GNV6_MEGSC
MADEEPSQVEDVTAKEKEELQTFINELQAKIESKTNLRRENMNCVRPSEDYFSKLDSSLKKNTAFVKKLKQFTSAQLDTLIKDANKICQALVEAKLKLTDVASIIILCSKLHQTYADFNVQFFEAWQRNFATKPGEKLSNSSKLRVDIRLFAELVSSGVINQKQGLNLLGNVLTHLISQDKEEHSSYNIILSFCKHCGEEYAGLVSQKYHDLAVKYEVQMPKSNFLPPEKQQALRGLLKEYFKTLSTHLLSEHQEIQSISRGIRKALESKGEVSDERKEKCELMQQQFDKFLTSAQTLSDLINEPLPILPKDKEEISGTVLDSISEGDLDPWRGDEETKSFYCDLPDLRQFLPNYAPKQKDIQLEEPSITEEQLDGEIDTDQLDVDDPPSSSSDVPNEAETDNPLQKKILLLLQHHLSGNNKEAFEQFLRHLNNCVNTELIDSAAIEFLLNFNTKNNRKKVGNYIFSVQRTRLDLLPFFSRFVAIINLVHADIANDLAHKLKMEFKWHIKRKNQLNIESKIKIVRFIGEMLKFGLYQKLEALYCLKILLQDFQHHQIEMACALIEVAGVYLYNCKDTRLRMNVFMEQMIRLKTNTHLDSRHSAQVENAYYLVKPPEVGPQEKKTRPIIHEYIRYLIFEELCKQNVDKSIKLMRRLNWDDPEILADLVSGIVSYQEKAIQKVIDNVFEDIRAGLEIHSVKLSQRRLAMAKYLGELYNYRLIESSDVLNTLYSIISLGVSFEEGVESPLDPTDSTFRLKLACVLLETSGQYFTSVLSRKRLDYFLVFFQHYYWHKKNLRAFSDYLLPRIVEDMYKDCLAVVRPKLKLFKSIEEAREAIDKLRRELYPTLFSQPSSRDGAGDTESEGNLETIREDSENDDMTGGETSEALVESDGDIRGNDDEEGEDYDDEYNDKEEESRESPEMLDDIEEMEVVDPAVTQEDLEFEQLKTEGIFKNHRKDIPVPMTSKTIKKSYDQIQSGKIAASTTPSPVPVKDESVPFVLMVRGGKGKQQFKTFEAPSDSALAINLRVQEQKNRDEKEMFKRITLNITERIEEEDYAIEQWKQKQNVAPNRFPNQNKSQKFKHQKGAPDVEAIFECFNGRIKNFTNRI